MLKQVKLGMGEQSMLQGMRVSWKGHDTHVWQRAKAGTP